ncbi:MAG: hypothetical protein KAU38_05230 [Desulfobacterales bacterium]|nr:hypothetical protein [Desulfobacterales bacterium]
MFHHFPDESDEVQSACPFIDALGPLRMRGVIDSAVHIGNDIRVLSHIQQYPWKASGYKTPLPESVKNDLRKRWNLQAWSGSGALYGTPQQNAGARQLIKKALRGIARVYFITDRRLRMIYKL